MNMTLTTPALLFPAISLLLLAYTNRFLVLAQVIRQLARMEEETPSDLVLRQVAMLRRRIALIRMMQTFAVISFLFCTLSMFAIFLGASQAGVVMFGTSLVLLAASLLVSLAEVITSTNAINVELQALEQRAARDG